MSALRFFERFQKLLDVDWSNIGDGQYLKRAGTLINGGTPAGGGGAAELPPGYLSGLTLSNNIGDATNDIDVAPGECRDIGDTADMLLSAVMTKRLDANWVVGTGQGGLDTGSIANTTYHVFLIKSGAGVVDVLFSVSSISPTMPSGYTLRRRVGSILRATGTILAFKQVGDYFQWVTPTLDVNVANQSTISINYSLSIPTGFKFLCRVNATLTHATFASLVLRDPETTDAAASAATAPISSLNMPTSGTAISGQFDLMTNTSGQIAARSSAASTTVRLVALGWFDYRDKPTTGASSMVVESPTYPAGYLVGLTLSNNATDAVNDIDIARGVCRDWLDTMSMELPELITKRLDAAWTAGTNQGGLDTGAIADATYHVYLIKRSDTGVVDALFSLSASAPTLPANYSHFRRVGSIIRESAAIVTFTQRGDEFLRTPVIDINTAALGNTTLLWALSVPTGIKVNAITTFRHQNAAIAYVLVTSPDQPNVPASATNAAMGNEAGRWGSSGMIVRTNTSAQIRCRTESATTTFHLWTHGWIDNRDIPGGGGTGVVAVTGGNVVGPVSAVDNHAAIFDGPSGKIIKSAGYRPSGVLHADYAQYTSTTAAGVVIWTIPILANMLGKNGDSLRVSTHIVTGGTSGTSRGFALQLNGVNMYLLATPVTSQISWNHVFTLGRMNASQVRLTYGRTQDNNNAFCEVATISWDTTVNNDLRLFIYTNTAANPVNHWSSTLEYLPIL